MMMTDRIDSVARQAAVIELNIPFYLVYLVILFDFLDLNSIYCDSACLKEMRNAGFEPEGTSVSNGLVRYQTEAQHQQVTGSISATFYKTLAKSTARSQYQLMFKHLPDPSALPPST